MHTLFTVVTGSQHKLAEYKRLIPGSIMYEHQALDLEEIQSLDSIEIITRKVKEAHGLLQRPVLVEDVAIKLDDLGGLPGPFIKFFEQRLGKGATHTLVGDDSPATVTCDTALYDGKLLLLGHGEVHGRIVAPRGSNGFGFDYCFVPEGGDTTYAEMSPSAKDVISHRALALADLLKQLPQAVR